MEPCLEKYFNGIIEIISRFFFLGNYFSVSVQIYVIFLYPKTHNVQLRMRVPGIYLELIIEKTFLRWVCVWGGGTRDM